MQGDTAEYGPARAQKNQTGKWYPQIPVDHTTLQINQRVVNTTLIPVKVPHCVRAAAADARLFSLQLFFAGWGYSSAAQASQVASMPRVRALGSSRDLGGVFEMPRKDGISIRL